MLGSVWVRIANNWAHDFASGLWGACVLVIRMLEGRLGALPSGEAGALAGAALADAQRAIWLALLGSLAAIAVTGGVRLAYWRAQTPAEEMPAKRPALVAKHVAYLAVYGLGTWWAWRMAG